MGGWCTLWERQGGKWEKGREGGRAKRGGKKNKNEGKEEDGKTHSWKEGN